MSNVSLRFVPLFCLLLLGSFVSNISRVQAQENHPPVFAEPELTFYGSEGSFIRQELPSAYDQDQTTPLSYVGVGTPEVSRIGLRAIEQANIFEWMPTFNQAGTYQFEVVATDNGNAGFPALSATQTITYIIEEAEPILNRLDQDIKDTVIGSGSSVQQIISCDDLTGHIENITLSLSVSSQPTYYRVDLKRAEITPDYLTTTFRRSADVLVSGGQQDVTFPFPLPIDVDGELCANGGNVAVLLQRSAGAGTRDVTVYGSVQNSYINGKYMNSETADMYFIVNGQAQENHLPVFEEAERIFYGKEGSYIRQELPAYDQDQTAPLDYYGVGMPQVTRLGYRTIEKTNIFEWLPTFNQAGTYQFSLVAVDDGNGSLPPANATQTITYIIEEAVPVLNRLEQTVKDSVIGTGSSVQQTISCDDLSGHIEKITLSLSVPSQATNYYVDLKKVGVTPDYLQTVFRRTNVVSVAASGQHDETFIFPLPIDIDGELCADGGNVALILTRAAGAGTKDVTVYGGAQNPYINGKYMNSETADMYFIINPHAVTNSAPTLTPIGNQTTTESQPLTFTVSATDGDNDTLTYSATNLPSGASFSSTTGEFIWTPDFNDAGEYQVTFTATEDTAEALSDSETITITVINFNRAPELAPIGNQTVNEGDTLEFAVSASDADGDDITLSATNLPAGATFNSTTGLFSWTTTFNDAGNYENIEFTATDNGTPMQLDLELITITVGDVNRLPELSNPGPQTVLEADTLTFSISATDPDNDTVTLSATNLPSGATFNTTTGDFSWTPTLADAGVYTVTITATDNGTPTESATIDVVITVGDNPTPTEQAEDLIEDIIILDIPQNVENSYLANLRKVEQFILEGKITAAINQLEAFINKIEQDYSQDLLTQEEYEGLLQAAEGLINDLNN